MCRFPVITSRLCFAVYDSSGCQRAGVRAARSSRLVIARHALEEVAQVYEGVFPVALAGDDERVEDGHALAGVGMSDEEPVFLADGRGDYRVFDQVVVETVIRVVGLGGDDTLVREQVCTDLPQRCAGQRLRAQT